MSNVMSIEHEKGQALMSGVCCVRRSHEVRCEDLGCFMQEFLYLESRVVSSSLLFFYYLFSSSPLRCAFSWWWMKVEI